jgi:hypothetical protein
MSKNDTALTACLNRRTSLLYMVMKYDDIKNYDIHLWVTFADTLCIIGSSRRLIGSSSKIFCDHCERNSPKFNFGPHIIRVHPSQYVTASMTYRYC